MSSDSSVAEALAHSDSLRTAKPALSRLETHMRAHTVILSCESTQYKPQLHRVLHSVSLNKLCTDCERKMYECVRVCAMLLASE